MPSVLFVCTANLCRSPMAMVMLQKQLEVSKTSSGWYIQSAGIWACNGRPVLEEVQIVARELGLDLSGHRARSVTREMLGNSDVILTMTKNQREALRVEYKDVTKRVHLLSEIVARTFDIQDPIGGDLSTFRRSAREINSLLVNGFPRLVQLALENSSSTNIQSNASSVSNCSL